MDKCQHIYSAHKFLFDFHEPVADVSVREIRCWICSYPDYFPRECKGRQRPSPAFGPLNLRCSGAIHFQSPQILNPLAHAPALFCPQHSCNAQVGRSHSPPNKFFLGPSEAMDTTTTDQAFAVLESWTGKLTQYLAAMGLVIVLYDCLLTIRDEVCPTLLCLRAAVAL
jgi:hypothetical protein